MEKLTFRWFKLLHAQFQLDYSHTSGFEKLHSPERNLSYSYFVPITLEVNIRESVLTAWRAAEVLPAFHSRSVRVQRGGILNVVVEMSTKL